jgi:hypothetical protein
MMCISILPRDKNGTRFRLGDLMSYAARPVWIDSNSGEFDLLVKLQEENKRAKYE